MISRHIKRGEEPSDETYARIIAETEAFLNECLRHPELIIRIPIIRVGHGEFPRSLTLAFWEPILND